MTLRKPFTDTQDAKAILGLVVFALLTVLPGACGGNGHGSSDETSDQLVKLIQLDPFRAKVGEAEFTLQLYGENFASGMTVLLNGSERATTFVNSERLEAIVETADLDSQNIFLVSVRDAQVNESNYLPFFIQTSVPRFLYGSHNQGLISAFSVDALSGDLTEVPGSPFAFTQGTFHLVAEPRGEQLYLLDNASSTVLQLSINRATGALSESGAPPISGVDWITMDPAGVYLFTSRGAYVIDPGSGNLSNDPLNIEFTKEFLARGFWDASARFFYEPVGNRYLGPNYAIDWYWFNRTTLEFEYRGSYIVGVNGGTAYGGTADPTGRRIIGRSVDDLSGSISVWPFNIDQITGEPSKAGGNIGRGPTEPPIFHPSGRYTYTYQYFSPGPDQIYLDYIELESGVYSKGPYYTFDDIFPFPIGGDSLEMLFVSPTGKHLYIQARYQGSYSLLTIPIDDLTGNLDTSPTTGYQIAYGSGHYFIVQ